MSHRPVTQAIFAGLPILLGALAACSDKERAPEASRPTDEALNVSSAKSTPLTARGTVDALAARFRSSGVPVVERGDASALSEAGFDGRRPAGRRDLQVSLPSDARGPVRLTSRSGRELSFRLDGAGQAAPTLGDGLAVYHGAAPGGGDLVHRLGDDSLEDFLVFEERPESETVSYTVDVSRFAGLRLAGGILEFLDESGSPELRVKKPYLVDANGARHVASLDVGGCQVDTSGAAPFHRPVTDPGSDVCSVRVTWGESSRVVYPALLDPAWTATASLVSARKGHTATKLSDGTVVIIGGEGTGGTYPTEIEVFDPTAAAGVGAFTTVVPDTVSGVALIPRAFHVAVARSDDSIVIAGGQNGSGAMASTQILSSVDIGGTSVLITDAADLTTARTGAQGVRISASSNNVVVTGGVSAAGTVLSSSQTLSALAGTWSAEVTMASPRRGHQVVMLGIQPMVVAGITTTTISDLSTSEIFSGGAWSPLGDTLTYARYFHAAATLMDPNGRVLVTGGYSRGYSSNIPYSEIFDANSAVWSDVGDLITARQYHTLTALPGGGAVVIGGATTTDGVTVATSGRLASVELFDSVTGQWAAGPALSGPRAFHTATLLADGRVLVVGGENNLPQILGTAEILGFDAPGAACTTSTACVTGYCVDGVCCDTACNQLCESCLAADTGGADGTCGAVTAGTDPADECTDSGGTTCAQNGFCSGAVGTCQTYLVPCVANPCTTGTECTSGYCVDGVCCDAPCAGQCEACTAALKGFGTDGTCEYVTSGQDPAGECASIGTGACAGAGACDGTGACISALSGTVCSPAACSDAVTFSYEAYCDDYGTCGTVSTDACAPYACDDVALSCKYFCTTDADCAPGVSCSGGTCQGKADGATCTTPSECQSGYCVDGYCCNDYCSGQCQACDVAGSQGYCTAVTGAPHDTATRGACAPSADAACAGTCDGSDPYNCTYPDSSTLCGAATCDGDNIVADACNGSGTCVNQTTTSCYPYGCSAGQCVSTCTTDSDCASGFLCDASGSCVGENQPSCQDDHTIVFPGGNTQTCVPYACLQGQCTSSCTTSDDCGGGNVCYETTGTCAAPKDSGCGCRVAGRPTSGSLGWLAALGVALAVARRRRVST